MILSGKKLFIYRLNKAKEFISMIALVTASLSLMALMFVTFC